MLFSLPFEPRQLEALGVDIIEAGFPAASQGDLHKIIVENMERQANGLDG